MTKPDLIEVKVVSVRRRGRFVFRWLEGETPRERVSKWPNKKTFRGKAERDALALQQELNDRDQADADLAWADFERRYATYHLASLKPKSASSWKTAAQHIREIINPAFLSDVTSASLVHMAAVLRARGLAETTIKTYLSTASAALGWAEEMEYIPARPKVRKPKRAKGKAKRMRGRPITGEEFDRLLSAAHHKRKRDSADWVHFLQGLWLSGLRIGEALRLSWEFQSDLSVDLERETPVFRITSEGDKRGASQLLPMAPDFAEWLLRVPRGQRRGRVFRVQVHSVTASKVISALGEAAGIIVSPDGRTATAHDLRRSFGTRWAKRVKPPVLQLLMRHADITTTMEYYVDMSVDEIGQELKTASKSGATGGALDFSDHEQVAKERASS